ncbi:MAG: YbaB/EbfC family nucleoid-associated protein [Chloroflexi bacterium]|nr:YbaB/EbfC family nucleoid-associated protein [Chloroflexota bacterium]
MSKRRRKGSGGPPRKSGSGGKGNNMNALVQQMQKMQEDMAKAQEELADEVFEVTAGGGMVKITITGHQRVQAIEVKPEVVDPDDIEMLQDLLTAAVNQAIEHSQEEAAKRMEGLTGGVDLPGLNL